MAKHDEKESRDEGEIGRNLNWKLIAGLSTNERCSGFKKGRKGGTEGKETKK